MSNQLIREIIGPDVEGTVEVQRISPENDCLRVIFRIEQIRHSGKLVHRRVSRETQLVIGQRWSL